MLTHCLKVILDERIRSFFGYELSRVFRESLEELFVEKFLELVLMWSGLLGFPSRIGFLSKLFKDFSGRKVMTIAYLLGSVALSPSFRSVLHCIIGTYVLYIFFPAS